jgi:nucleotide-binding universal stress UspA family protein
MKILLVVDGSSYSNLSIQMIKALRLPPGNEITLLTVVPEPNFLGSITLDAIIGSSKARAKANDEQQEKALELLGSTSQALSKSKMKIDTMVRWGNPTEEIVSVAEQEKASLIIMGAKGLTDPANFRLGSVALKVAKYANSNVLLVRKKTASLAEEPPKKEGITRIKRVLIATDGSKYADDGIRMSPALFSPRRTEILILTALHSHHESWWKSPTLKLVTNREALAKIQAAEAAEARKIIGKAEKKFQDKGYMTKSFIKQGEASDCIITAAIEYHPDIVVLGSRGLTGIESYLLGSVAERVARYANCSVFIGRGM